MKTRREVFFESDAKNMIDNLQERLEKNIKKGKFSSKDEKLLRKIMVSITIIEREERISRDLFQKIKGLKKSYEIRIDFDGKFHRFFGVYENNNLVIMRYYLSKKTNKTPKTIISKLKRDEKTI